MAFVFVFQLIFCAKDFQGEHGTKITDQRMVSLHSDLQREQGTMLPSKYATVDDHSKYLNLHTKIF